MPQRDPPRQPPLRRLLYVLLLAGGLVPLAVADYLLLSTAPRDGRLLETLAILLVPVLLLVALAWVVSGWGEAAIVEPARRLSAALGRLAGGRFENWVSPGGAVSELAALSDELNRMSARTQETVRTLQQKEHDSRTLAADAMRLFRQAVQAKEPLTRHHPGLLEAYSDAVTRQLAEKATEFESSEIAMSPFEKIDPVQEEQTDRRAQPRYEVGDLVVDAPVGARVVDVSSVGLGLETMERLALGGQDSFEVVEKSRRLRIPGEAVWCKLVRTVKTVAGDSVPVYRAGVRFAKAFSTTDRDELLEIVQQKRHVA